MKVVNQVNQTNDYSLFKTLKGNRVVNKLHVNRLSESFRKQYLMSPIIVNQDYQIIDGQHRFEAARNEGLPVNFIICNDYSLKQVQLLNTNMKNWLKVDYLNAYCDLEYPEYLRFREFMERYPEFCFASCEFLLVGHISNGKQSNNKEYRTKTNKRGSYTVRSFQEGDFTIQDYDHSCHNAEKILKVMPYYEGFSRRSFVGAMCSVFKVKEYEHKKLLTRLKSNPAALSHRTNIGQYKELIEEVYNFRNQNKITLRF